MKFKVILFWPSCGQIGNKLLQYQNQINKMGRSVRRDVSDTIFGRCWSAEWTKRKYSSNLFTQKQLDSSLFFCSGFLTFLSGSMCCSSRTVEKEIRDQRGRVVIFSWNLSSAVLMEAPILSTCRRTFVKSHWKSFFPVPENLSVTNSKQQFPGPQNPDRYALLSPTIMPTGNCPIYYCKSNDTHRTYCVGWSCHPESKIFLFFFLKRTNWVVGRFLRQFRKRFDLKAEMEAAMFLHWHVTLIQEPFMLGPEWMSVTTSEIGSRKMAADLQKS